MRVRPDLKEHPAEVFLLFQTPYELKIPSDSVVLLRRAGLLGEVYAEVDLHDASGSPIGGQGVLKSREEESARKEEANPTAANPAKRDLPPPIK